ncbi:MAG TPA: DUF2279 domain-containing protein [Chitinophagaceae bacterium]|nr:DUF2279 domain-containing protein [Chitinophagaceae bacterium]
MLVALAMCSLAQDNTLPAANTTDTSAVQKALAQPGVSSSRLWWVTGLHVAFWTGSYIALDKTWYSNYPRSSFHFFNDNTEWQQMDKLGHVWTSYNVARASAGLWAWTKLPPNKAALYGSLSAVAYQSIIEIQDGFSAEWGFSWGDMAANVVGAGAFLSQQLGWKEQRVQVKMSYWPYSYEASLIGRRNQLFGSGPLERTLKDYNSQTYWVSANLHSFFKKSSLPAWLNVAVGYGADGMLGGTENRWTDKQGNQFDRTDIPRVRRFFIAPDIDLTRIKTNKKWLRTVLFAFNSLKIPAPAIELNSKGRLRGHWLFY